MNNQIQSWANWRTAWRRFGAVMLLWCVALVLAGGSWSPVQAQSLPGIGTPANKASAPAPDPYGRESPRSMVTGLLAAFAAADYTRASQFIEAPATPLKEGTTDPRIEAARQLQRTLDTSGTLQPLPKLSSASVGNTEDGLIGTDQIGALRTSGGELPVMAKRVEPADAAPHWVVSAESMRSLALARPELEKSALDDALPDALQKIRLAGAPVADWLVLLARALAAVIASAFLFYVLLRLVTQFVRDPDHHRGAQFAQAAFPPLALYVAVVGFWLSTQRLQVAIVAREAMQRGATMVAAIAFAWFVWRLIDALSDLWRERMARRDRRGAMAALVFARRTAKSVLCVVVLVAVLGTLGFDVTTGIAALGLGGLALALGAQKTIENLVGSISVIADQPARVGDYCKVGDVAGTVEDVGMRSTRIRTLARTVVSIPNGMFASLQIENYSKRDRFLFNPTIGLTYATRAGQMQTILEALRTLLSQDLNVMADPRVRFIDFGASALNIEIFAYLLTDDMARSLEMREALLLRIMACIEDHGASIAFPTQTVMLDRAARPGIPGGPARD